MRHYAPFHLFLELTDTAHVWTRGSYDKNYWQLEWNPYLSTFKCSSKYFIIPIDWNQFNNISYNFTIVILLIESSPRWSDVEWLIANRLWLSSNTTFFIRKKNFWMFWLKQKQKKTLVVLRLSWTLILQRILAGCRYQPVSVDGVANNST